MQQAKLPAVSSQDTAVAFAEFTPDQYRMLMEGLNPLEPRIREVHPSRVL